MVYSYASINQYVENQMRALNHMSPQIHVTGAPLKHLLPSK